MREIDGVVDFVVDRLPFAVPPHVTPQEHAAVASSYRPAVRGWVIGCVSERDVDDVVQSVFEALARDYARIDLCAVPTWLRKVTRGKVIDHGRKRREALDDPPEPPSGEPDPERTLRSRELAAAVQEGLRRVPSSRRGVLVAVALEGRTVADVARAEGIPESTVQSRYEQAGKDLRAVMERERASERRRSGGFTSWAFGLGVLADLRTLVLRWRRAIGVGGAAVVAGALLGGAMPAEVSTRGELPTRSAPEPVVLVEEPPAPAPPPFVPEAPVDARTSAPSIVEKPPADHRPRLHHDLHRHFEREAFGPR